MTQDKENALCTYSGLSLAYMGDAVFDLLVRTRVLRRGNQPAKQLHKEAKKYVNATAQAQMYHYIFEQVTEEEQKVLQRGRNAKSFSTAKNATKADYRYATGLEALFGYLHLGNQQERLEEVFALCMQYDQHDTAE